MTEQEIKMVKLPERIDHLRDKMPPVKDQGELGASTSFAMGAETWAFSLIVNGGAALEPKRISFFTNPKMPEVDQVTKKIRYHYRVDDRCRMDRNQRLVGWAIAFAIAFFVVIAFVGIPK